MDRHNYHELQGGRALTPQNTSGTGEVKQTPTSGTLVSGQGASVNDTKGGAKKDPKKDRGWAMLPTELKPY